MMQTELNIAWCDDSGMADAIARFFVAHAPTSYISHSELQWGRAVTPDRWSDRLHAVIREEADEALARRADGTGRSVALARIGQELVGLAFVSFEPAGAQTGPFAVLDDVIVSSAGRGQGVGQALLDWIVAESRRWKLARIFLESGADNARAHAFFERRGFRTTSIVMMLDL
jgi:ribosomal protein S18 acetylase RimI-like enzyme